MPNIDTSAIEGFDAMTPEQKVEALLKVDVPEKIDLTGYVKKDIYDKTASELADAKKQVKAKMTEDEAAKAKEAEERQKLQEDYNTLLKKSTIADYTASYLAMGYEEKLARSTAEALFDGDMEKVFANQKLHQDAQAKAIRNERMKDTPGPNGAGGGGEQTPKNVELAAQLGKERAASLKASNDIVSMYTK